MLKRLGTDRVDFLLAHALNDFGSWARLREARTYPEFLAAAKAAGTIRLPGFSWHGNKEEFKKVVDDYPWEFCQIQYNYLDEHNQAGTEGLEYAAAKGLGVVVMEPLRGAASWQGRCRPRSGRLGEHAADANAANGASTGSGTTRRSPSSCRGWAPDQ